MSTDVLFIVAYPSSYKTENGEKGRQFVKSIYIPHSSYKTHLIRKSEFITAKFTYHIVLIKRCEELKGKYKIA